MVSGLATAVLDRLEERLPPWRTSSTRAAFSTPARCG